MFGIAEFLLLADELCHCSARAMFAAAARFAAWGALGFGDGASAVTVELSVAALVDVFWLLFLFYHAGSN